MSHYCSGCGVLSGCGHSLGCAYAGGFYSTTADNTSGQWWHTEAETIFRNQCLNDLNKAVIDELFKVFSPQEEPVANNIDEKQIDLLDNMRSARDAAYRYAQSKHDRATLMRIQADALEREGNEIVSEINEGVPAPESK